MKAVNQLLIFTLIISLSFPAWTQNTQVAFCSYRETSTLNYICTITFANINRPDLQLNITGNHLEGKTNEDVIAIETTLRSDYVIINFIHPQFFEHFPNLEMLALFSTQLTQLNTENCQKLKELSLLDQPIEDIPPLSNCTNLKDLNLFFLPNATVRDDTFKGLASLESLGIAIAPEIRIANESFSDLINLRDIFLQSIGHIDDGALRGLRSLERVSLNVNSRGFDVFERLLQGLGHLRSISLSGNGLEDVNFGFLSEFEKLSELDLSTNNLTEIPSGAFEAMHGLTRLRLSSNKIATLERDSLRNLSNLEYLNVGDNPILSLTTLPFDHLANLKELQLYSTSFSVLPSQVFKHNQNLEFVYIYNGLLEEIEENGFSSLPNLKLLYLYGNKLKSLRKLAFHDLPSLDYLTLDSNNIERLNTESFGVLPNLTTFDVRINLLDYIQPNFFGNLPNLQIFRSSGNICLNRNIIDFQSIDFSMENLFSTCFYNWQYGRTTTERLTTPQDGATSDETTTSSASSLDLIMSVSAMIFATLLSFPARNYFL